MQNLCNFILSSNVKSWDSKSKILQELDKADVILQETPKGDIEGCLILIRTTSKTFHCSLVIAKSKSIFKSLALKFKQRFPDCEVTSAFRKTKHVTYKKSIIKKVSNIYG